MKVEVIKKKPLPVLQFQDLANGDVFRFLNEDSNTYLWMKVGCSAMRISKTDEIIPVISSTKVDLYESHLVIQGK